MLSIFNDKMSCLYKKMLDITSMRQNIISNNIANVNTPNFKRSDVDFQAQLKNAISQDEPSVISDIEPVKIMTDNTPVRLDGNNVDLNSELSIIAKNSVMYKMYIQFTKGRFDKLREAMKSPN